MEGAKEGGGGGYSIDETNPNFVGIVYSQTHRLSFFLLVIKSTCPELRAIGMAQHTTRGVDRSFGGMSRKPSEGHVEDWMFEVLRVCVDTS